MNKPTLSELIILINESPSTEPQESREQIAAQLDALMGEHGCQGLVLRD